MNEEKIGLFDRFLFVVYFWKICVDGVNIINIGKIWYVEEIWFGEVICEEWVNIMNLRRKCGD